MKTKHWFPFCLLGKKYVEYLPEALSRGAFIFFLNTLELISVTYRRRIIHLLYLWI